MLPLLVKLNVLLPVPPMLRFAPLSSAMIAPSLMIVAAECVLAPLLI